MTSMSDVEEEFEELADDELAADAESEELGEDEEMEDLDDDEELDDLDDETRNELKVVDEVLSQKEQNARSLAIRRALEQRMDDKQLHDDLDYLDD
jgi:hypothetical protein